jgi:hypothetical protein
VGCDGTNICKVDTLDKSSPSIDAQMCSRKAARAVRCLEEEQWQELETVIDLNIWN